MQAPNNQLPKVANQITAAHQALIRLTTTNANFKCSIMLVFMLLMFLIMK